MFREYFSICSEIYRRKLPSKQQIEEINKNYFINYYDFALMMTTEIKELIRNTELSDLDPYYQMFARFPNFSEINLDEYFCNVWKKYYFFHNQ